GGHYASANSGDEQPALAELDKIRVDNVEATLGDYQPANFNVWTGNVAESVNAVASAALALHNKAAVGIRFGWYPADNYETRKGGHVVTMWGYCYDSTQPNSSPTRYTDLIISCPDDQETKYDDPTQPIRYKTAIDWVDEQACYVFKDYDSDGKEGRGNSLVWGIIQNFYVLKSKDAMKTANAYVVTTTSDVVDPCDGVMSLREATLLATSRDTVTFDKSLKNKTITLSGTEIKLVNGVTIDASLLMNADGTPGITVDGGGESRVFYVTGGTESDPATFNGLTVAGGSASFGGGVYVDDETAVKFVDCTITGNEASSSGGGVYVDDNAQATFENCAMTGTTAASSGSGSGGGVYVDVNAQATFTGGCAISANKAKYGGGLRINGSATLVDCTISGNDATSGAGVYLYGAVSTTFTSCKITDNTATNNSGGVYVDGKSKATLANCLISGNEAATNGGGVYVNNASATFRNSTISGNTAKYGGGARVYVASGAAAEALFYNTIVALNTATSSGADVHADDVATVNAYNTLSSYKSWDASENAYVYDAERSLFNNGAYTLAADSQAIDQGKNAYISGHSTDLAGKARVSGTYVDLGAYEYQQAPSLTSVLLRGTAQVGKTLTASVSPSGATATYQWYYGSSASSATTKISGATSNSFTITDAYVGKYLNVVATGGGSYTGAGEATSAKVAEKPSLVVTTNGDAVDAYDGKISLREAIQYAEAGSTIAFATSLKGKTITLTGTELEIAKGITVDASSLYNSSTNTPGVTIDADEKSRVFSVSGGTASNPVALIGLTITGGKTDGNGGGVCVNSKASATLDKCAIRGNSAKYGGGLYITGSATLTDCSIDANKATSGAGVYFYDAVLATLVDCEITGNTATNNSGGVYVDGKSKATLNDCEISGNEAANNGGGVFVNSNASATLTNCTVSGNTSSGRGGGIFVASDSTLTLTNSEV
ncbi:MAG: right-handed parallel beta-helix repeat-containing protein, partial [Thermoguttaceae bacterium]|nr:right-handed parallel beta-helix repeat-containing protein [Thermoguttaceae bacterium]